MPPDLQAKAYEQSLRHAFPICNELLLRRGSSPATRIDCALSGSTGCVAVATPEGLLVAANVGDSRCVIGEWAAVEV